MFTLGLMVSVHLYIDASLLAKLVPADVVGWYGATAVFSGTLLAPAVILASTVYPRLSRAANDPVEFARLVRGALRPVLFVSMLVAVGTFAFADFAIATVYHKDDFAPAATILRLFSVNLFLVSIDVLLGNVILASGGVRRFARAKAVAIVCSVGLELFLVPWCQRRFGNGGIGVVLSFVAGEVFMIAAALRIIPAGVIDRATLLDGGRAVAAGLGALLAAWIASPLSPFVAIPITIAAHTAASFALGLVTRADLQRVLGLVGSDKREQLVRVPARAA
jgi:O-antigen/teichoic acid export membrane protein